MKNYLLIALFTIPLLWNLLKPGFYTSHDGEWMVIRLTAFHDALRQGQFPVRWLPRLNHGYGYPVANFLYPLPFYLAEPVYFLTGNPATAVQFVMAVSIISMAAGMFAFLSPSSFLLLPSSFKKNWPAFVGSLAYVYSPYVAFNLYQRGSLGETVAMGIAPWIFWAISRSKLPVAAVLTAGLILSHNVVAILFLPLIVFYLITAIILRPKAEESRRDPSPSTSLGVRMTTYTLILGLGLSAFFWLPALLELRFVRSSQISVSDFQNEYLAFTEALNRTGIITAIFSSGSPLFFLTKSSIWFWQIFSPLQIIQFPWRLLSLFSFISAAAAGYLMRRMSHMSRMTLLTGIALSTIAFVSSTKYFRPESFINRPPEYYQTNDDTTTVRAEYTPIWVTDLPKERPETPQIHYYPGWKIFIDGKEIPAADPATTNGILMPAAPAAASANIQYRFSETRLRTFANLLSIAAALTWLRWSTKSPKPVQYMK